MLTVAQKRPPEERRHAFGRALDQAMAARDVSQRELGELVGIRQPGVSGWVTGDTVPEPDVVFELERILKLDPGHLSQHLGYLPPEAAKKGSKPSFESVLLEDPLLSEDAKRGLLAAYREFIARRRQGRRR